MELKDIVSRFESPKPRGNNSYMVKCPCHNDNTQSLSVTDDNGTILLQCFGGCSTEEIIEKVGLKMKDLFNNTTSKSFTKKPPSIEYMYSDKLKKVRFYKLVKGKWIKSFCWNYKDDNGKWQKGKGDYKVPLYKQHLLSTATDKDIVYIVEGEKDTDTLTDKLQLIAVSSPNGATKANVKGKWNSSYNKLFEGLNVVIIPDNDDIGRAYAENIAIQLLSIAKSVKVVDLRNEWDNLKDKGDITDIYENETPTTNKTIADIVRFKLSALTELTELYKPKDNTEFQADVETPRKTIIAPIWAYEDNGQWKIDEKLYITEFVKKHGVKCINGQLYSVDGIIQDGKAKQIIIKEILCYVKSNHGDKAEKLLKGIKQYCYIEPPKPDIDKIHFLNGTLSRDNNGLFTVWSDKKEFCVNRINANYNPDALLPKIFIDYLNTVYYEDDIQTLQQYCGYCLLPTTVLQKALLIIGDGGEGKSVLGAILNAIVGENNCYNASIKDLEGNFGVANVENKLIYIDDDISEKALSNSGIFKSLVTNKNNIEAKKKYQQSNVIKSYIRFICFGNFALQSLYDTSDGFYRRLLALRVKPKNANRLDNPFIDREIIDNESEGVVNWLIQGLNEIIKRNFKIYTSERTNTESERIKHENDSVLAFLQSDFISINKDLKIHTRNLYHIYEGFCDENALIKLHMTSFPSAIKCKGKQFGITPSENITIRGKRARGFKGIGIDVNIS